MSGRANQPRDLVWNLEKFQSPDNALKFFDAFNNAFIIYSQSVQKLYCEYSTQATGPSGRRRMVVLPDFNKFESIFSRINPEAVSETSITIYPVVQGSRAGLYLSGKTKSDGTLKQLPLKKGLRALRMDYFKEGNLLPLLMLGDLREFPEKNLPYLKLHTLDCEKLTEISEFERKDIKTGTWAKLKQLL